MIRLGVMSYWPPGLAPTDAQRTLLATKRAWVWLKLGQDALPNFPASLDGPADYAHYRALSAGIKARGAARVGVYVGGFDPDSHHPHYAALDDADLLHHPDGRPARLVADTPPSAGQRLTKLPNYGSPAVRAKLIAWWADWLDEMDLDGVCFDSFAPAAYAQWASGWYGLSAGAAEGPAHTTLWWTAALSAFVRDLRARLSRDGRTVMVNGLGAMPWDPASVADQVWGRYNTGIVDFADVALAEHVHAVWSSRAQLEAYLEMGRLLEARGSGTFFLCQPWLHHQGTGAFPSGDRAVREYYLCAYLLVANEETTYGYHDKTAYFGFDETALPMAPYVFDGPELYIDVGEPVGAVSVNRHSGYDVLCREYTKAWVILNPNEPGVKIPGVAGSPGWGFFGDPGGPTFRYWAPDGPAFPSFANIAPKSGTILFK